MCNKVSNWRLSQLHVLTLDFGVSGWSEVSQNFDARVLLVVLVLLLLLMSFRSFLAVMPSVKLLIMKLRTMIWDKRDRSCAYSWLNVKIVLVIASLDFCPASNVHYFTKEFHVRVCFQLFNQRLRALKLDYEFG